MIRTCLLTLAGGLLAQHNRVAVSSDFCELLIVAAVCGLFVRRLRAIGCVVLGFGLFVLAANTVADARLDQGIAGERLLAQIRVTSAVKVLDRSVSFIAAPVADRRLPERMRIRWLDPTQLPALGEVWQLELRLRRPRGYSNPGGFDLEAWMFRENLHASAYVVASLRNRRLAIPALDWMVAYKVAFVERAKESSTSAESAAVLAAIGVGERHLVTRAQWDRYAATGTSHLMAISGLHVGLAASVSFLLLMTFFGGLRLPGNTLACALIASVGVAALYAGVSGFAVPARRAICMLLLASLVVAARRRLQPGRILAFSALLVFALDPIAAMSPGFNLSFAAVLVLLLHAQGLLRSRSGSGRLAALRSKFATLLRMQGALLFGLLPLTAFFFQRVALLAPAVNLLLVPLFSFITVPLALLALLVLRLSDSASGALLRLASRSVEVGEAIVAAFAGVAPAGFVTVAWYGLLPTLVWVILPRGWPGRWLGVVAVLALVLQRPSGPPAGCFDAHVLDVGQGLAIVVQTAEHSLMFDTGVAYLGGGSAAESVVLPFLRARGIQALDWLIVSHADLDHAGGVRALQETLGVGLTLLGEAIPQARSPIVLCSNGQRWHADGVHFEVLHPDSSALRNGNNASCVVVISVGEHRLLLTGDIEATAELEIIRRGALPKMDVVVVPHHGSSTSSTRGLIRVIDASLAIVSAGYNNRWGFPKDDVVRRWQLGGARVLNTARSGAVSVRLCENGGLQEPRQHRLRQHRFWRDRVAR
jgi:competence protein ComEC